MTGRDYIASKQDLVCLGEIVSIRHVVDPQLGTRLNSPFMPKPPSGASPYRNRTAVTILRRRQVEAESGYSRSTIYLRISQGLWPRAVSLGARAVGWPASEVSALNAARIAGLSDNQIRQLVVDLVAARHAAAPQADQHPG